MNLSHLKNEELNQSLKSLVIQEREILSEILQQIAEVDRRRLYLEMAYPNLFSYLTEYLGYSAGSAQRRMDAARLLQEAPALPQKLESGELNLAQVSLLQKALRQKKRESHLTLTSESKSQLLESLCGLSLDQSAEILSRELDLELKTSPQIHIQKDKSVRIELTLSEAQWQKLQAARELLSHSLPHGSWDQVLESLCDRFIAQKTKVKPEKKAPESDPAKDSRPVHRLKLSVKKEILKRDQCCQWRDPRTSKQCASTWQLQVDHRQPQWAGGLHQKENLQILCGPHNRFKYQKEAQIRPNFTEPSKRKSCSNY